MKKRVNPRFQRHLSLHFKHHLADGVHANLPKTSLRQDVSPEFVSRTLVDLSAEHRGSAVG